MNLLDVEKEQQAALAKQAAELAEKRRAEEEAQRRIAELEERQMMESKQYRSVEEEIELVSKKLKRLFKTYKNVRHTRLRPRSTERAIERAIERSTAGQGGGGGHPEGVRGGHGVAAGGPARADAADQAQKPGARVVRAARDVGGHDRDGALERGGRGASAAPARAPARSAPARADPLPRRTRAVPTQRYEVAHEESAGNVIRGAAAGPR